MSHKPKRQQFPPIVPIALEKIGDPKIRAYLKQTNQKLYGCGLLTIYLKEHENNEFDLSISHPKRYPTWDEIAYARYTLLPHDRCYALLLPPPEAFFSISHNMFHMFEVYMQDDPKAQDRMFFLGKRREIDAQSLNLAWNTTLDRDKPEFIRLLKSSGFELTEQEKQNE